MKLLSFLCILGGLIFFSCKSKNAEENEVESTQEIVVADTISDLRSKPSELPANIQAYEAEIMRIHDEVMPRTNELRQLASRLKAVRANAQSTDEIDDLLESIDNAEQFMMNWMKEYADNKDKLPEDKKMGFYEKQLGKITHSKTLILNAIDKANAWLAAHPS